MKQLKLLLVDDEPQVLESLSQLFDYEYKVLTATSGEAALSLLNAHRDIAIIISDQRMGGMRGVDLLRHVKQQIPESIRILLTGYSDLESVLQSVNVGEVFRYVRKPWQPDTLKSIVALAAATYILRGQREKRSDSAPEKSPLLVNALKTLPPPPELSTQETPSIENTPPPINDTRQSAEAPPATLKDDFPVENDFLSDLEKTLTPCPFSLLSKKTSALNPLKTYKPSSNPISLTTF